MRIWTAENQAKRAGIDGVVVVVVVVGKVVLVLVLVLVLVRWR